MHSEQDLTRIGALGDDTRRRLYDVVVTAGRLVSRDEAAAETGVDRSTAAYHLDKLAGAGLLDVEYQRLTGRQGPGAGRPAKLYRRAAAEVEVSLPPRDYEMVAELLATVVEAVGPDETVVDDVARGAGRRLGAGVGPTTDVKSLLAARGYEPDEDPEQPGRLLLRNCPFHHLARDHRTLVCGMNQGLISGLLDEIGDGDHVAVLDPAPERCCVVLDRNEPA